MNKLHNMLNNTNTNSLTNFDTDHVLAVVCWCGSVRVVVTATPLTVLSRPTACSLQIIGGASDLYGVPTPAGDEVASLSILAAALFA